MAARSVRGIQGVLLDLSGTVHVEDTPTPNAVEAITKLQSSGLKVRYVTNTTKESKRRLFQRLQKMGFHNNISPEQIFTSLSAARRILVERQLNPLLLVDEEAKEDLEGLLPESADINDSVLVGLAPSKFEYSMMNKAFQVLLNGGSLLAIHKSRYYKTSQGLSLGPGPFVAALEYASNVTAQVIGKPEPSFYNTVLNDIECIAGETIMIGDDVINDIKGAQDIGMKAILVKTGKYRHGDECTISPPPYAVCDSLATAVHQILTHKKNLIIIINSL